MGLIQRDAVIIRAVGVVTVVVVCRYRRLLSVALGFVFAEVGLAEVVLHALEVPHDQAVRLVVSAVLARESQDVLVGGQVRCLAMVTQRIPRQSLVPKARDLIWNRMPTSLPNQPLAVFVLVVLQLEDELVQRRMGRGQRIVELVVPSLNCVVGTVELVQDGRKAVPLHRPEARRSEVAVGLTPADVSFFEVVLEACNLLIIFY